MDDARDEWIGVAEVAAEMKYTPRQAWEFIRKIGLVVLNTTSVDLARFTRREYEEARDRAKVPLTPRAWTRAIVSAVTTDGAASRSKAERRGESVSAKVARIRKA